jgi:hypothetical protein
MKLLTQALRAQLPKLYATEHIRHADKMAVCKFFTPDSSWTWFVCEAGAGEDEDILFGFVIGHEAEWGYFSLAELESVRGPLGLPIERDLGFRPQAMRLAAPNYFLPEVGDDNE